jgi:serine/threonine protein kinase
MTGMTGSPRYMAPEVALANHYNESCDTYSFAILLWEMMALQIPFWGYTISKLEQTVWKEPHVRPKVDGSWPVPVKLLLKRAWSADIKGRSSMKNISTILRKEVVAARAGDDSGLEHQKRRSTFVFRGRQRTTLGDK